MTVTVEKARCPQCGNTETFAIFIRSDDGTDLVCRSHLRREGSVRAPTNPSPSAVRSAEVPSRRVFGRRR